MLKIRRLPDRLIFNMGIPIPGKTVLILKRGPGCFCYIRYLSETQHQLKFQEISFAYDLFISYPIILKFCLEKSSGTILPCLALNFKRTYWLKTMYIWVRSWWCDCLVTWFCYQMIATPGNKKATPLWPDPYLSGQLRSISLTHWGRDKMAAVSQTTLSNAFSWMKMYKFRLIFHLSLFPRVQLTILQHWFR